MKTEYLSVTAVRTEKPGIHFDIFTDGDTNPLTMDLVADELKRRAGTYEKSPLEEYLEQQGLELKAWPATEAGRYWVRIGSDVCVRAPGSSHGLLSAAAEGDSPADARRRLAALISGRTLVECPTLPIRREYRVPDLMDGSAAGKLDAETTAQE